MTSMTSVEEFVGQSRLVVLGASRKPHKFGHQAVKELAAKGYELFPVHPSAEENSPEKLLIPMSAEDLPVSKGLHEERPSRPDPRNTSAQPGSTQRPRSTPAAPPRSAAPPTRPRPEPRNRSTRNQPARNRSNGSNGFTPPSFLLR